MAPLFGAKGEVAERRRDRRGRQFIDATEPRARVAERARNELRSQPERAAGVGPARRVRRIPSLAPK